MRSFKLKISVIVLIFSVVFFGILAYKSWVNILKTNKIEEIKILSSSKCEIIKQSDKSTGAIIANQDKLIYNHAKGEEEKDNPKDDETSKKKNSSSKYLNSQYAKNGEYQAIMKIIEERKEFLEHKNQNNQDNKEINKNKQETADSSSKLLNNFNTITQSNSNTQQLNTNKIQNKLEHAPLTDNQNNNDNENNKTDQIGIFDNINQEIEE